MKALRIAHVFQQIGVFDARRAESVGAAAQRQHQAREAQRARGHHLLAMCIALRGQGDGLARGVQPGQFAHGEAEMVAPREHGVRQTLLMGVQRPGRDFVQRGLPDVERKAVHQQHPLTPLSRPQRAAQACSQFQPAGPTPHDHDVVMHVKPSSRLPLYSVGKPAPIAALRKFNGFGLAV